MSEKEFWIRAGVGAALVVLGLLIGSTVGFLVLVAGAGLLFFAIFEAVRQVRRARAIEQKRAATR